MKEFNNLIQKLESTLEMQKIKLKSRRIFLSLSHEQFKNVFLLHCNIMIAERGLKHCYEIDENNREVINQIFYYVTGNENFNGNLNKGLMISGNIGTGKTMIINALINIIHELSNFRFTKLHSKSVAKYLNKNKDFSYKIPFFIDDIGKETKNVNDFGTIINPIPDLFSICYDQNNWMFVTSNYDKKTLNEYYGETIIDRFKEMFNILILKGNSRRR